MGFTAPQAARLAGCSSAQLDYWQRCGLVIPHPDEPDGPYTFRDLVALRMVRSLLDAYAAGEDGQKTLTLLSTYLGHVDPAGTYWYLSASPELLAAAGQRLERRLGGRR